MKGETFYLWDRVLTDEEIQLLAEADWPSPPWTLSVPIPCALWPRATERQRRLSFLLAESLEVARG